MPSTGGPDIILHGNVLRSFGQSSALEGSKIELRVRQGENGLQASEIVSLQPPANPVINPAFEIMDMAEDDLERIPLLPARVKWFDRARGFGFAQQVGDPEDIFLHNKILRENGFDGFFSGEAIGVRSSDTPRGKIALQVTSWFKL